MSGIETEVKFRVDDVAALERRLAELEFRKITPRTFEQNTLFDTPDRSLRNRRETLRIRRYGERWLLTHKCLPDDGHIDVHHKQRIETETYLDDGEALGEIFVHLGYRPVFRYEKWRTEWADDQGHCVIDETPIGLFAELEGPPDWIDATSERLDLHSEDLMTLSYGRLFEDWCAKTGHSGTDLTFAAIGAPQKS